MQNFDSIRWPDGLDAERFIAEYWQKKPLYIPQAFPGFENPLPADEIGGLACEEGVVSRLLIESRGSKPWELRQGPFDPEIFDWLSEHGWSLLVGDIDKLLPEFRHYLTPFRFIPDWRIDDLMASFAPPGGSAGPHYDHYDVFLWQVEGERTWHIGPEPKDGYTLIPDVDVKIIAEPEFDESIDVSPGDLLYLPPGYAHHGVANTACITWSVGFRAPTASDLANGWTDEVTHALADASPLKDASFSQQENPGEISAGAREQMRNAVVETLKADGNHFDRWLAKHLTDRPADLELNPNTDAQALELLATGAAQLERRADIRFAFQQLGDTCFLYAGGQEILTSREIAAALCQSWQWQDKSLHQLWGIDGAPEVIAELLNHGFLEILDGE